MKIHVLVKDAINRSSAGRWLHSPATVSADRTRELLTSSLILPGDGVNAKPYEWPPSLSKFRWRAAS